MQYERIKYPDGSISCRINDFNDRRITERINNYEDLIFIKSLVECCHYNGHYDLELFIPCLLSAQADRRFEENESFDLKIIADIINSCEFTRVEIFDPHSDVTGALINNSHIVTNAEFIMDTLSKINSIAGWDYRDIVLVSPDAGAFKKIYKLAKDINFEGEIITCSKSRDNSKGELELRVPKFPEGKVALIIDDICLGGRTFTTIAEKLRENGYSEKQMFLAISHGVFNQGFEKLKDHFTKIYVTNSKQESYSNDFMKTIIYKII